MMHLLTQFLLALFATAGFCVIFRVPVRHIPICMIIGGFTIRFRSCRFIFSARCWT